MTDPRTSLRWYTRRIGHLFDGSRIFYMANQVARHASASQQKPVVFFNASTRLTGLSLNAAFSLMTSWAIRLVGVPIIHFVCRAGMSHCVLGTDQDDFSKAPPCRRCIHQSRLNYTASDAHYFSFRRDPDLEAAIRGKDIGALSSYEHPYGDGTIPLGSLVLPALRWRLRLHNLTDDESVRFLFREFILSAWNVAREFTGLIDRRDPQAAVVFNGQFFPEATVRWIALRYGIRTVTHEVGLQPMSGYFTTGEATAYPITIPDDFDLNPKQNARLDAYLEKRFQGKFSMAGIRFWPEMKGLPASLLKKAAGFRQVIPVFTNVIFDTSQPHSNVIFPEMFTWLDRVLTAIKGHPETLFVLRAHPDESRPGKAARETVADWVERNHVSDLPNTVFIPPDEYLSSYELIQRSKFVMIYNSTIGLEATIMGAPVLCAGKARFTQYQTVFFPQSQEEYYATLENFLQAEKLEPLPEHVRQARRFLYYQLFRTSLPFGDFLETTHQRGYVRFKPEALNHLLPESTPALRTLLNGILRGGDFLLEE